MIQVIDFIRIEGRWWDDPAGRGSPGVAEHILQESHDVKDTDEGEEEKENESKRDPQNKG